MAAYIIRRLLQMIPTLIGVVLLVFFLFKYFGGDPAEILGGLNATPQQIDAIREQLGLNEPWWVQLWIYLKGIVTLDWGRSWATNEAVSNIFATRLPATPCARSATKNAAPPSRRPSSPAASAARRWRRTTRQGQKRALPEPRPRWSRCRAAASSASRRGASEGGRSSGHPPDRKPQGHERDDRVRRVVQGHGEVVVRGEVEALIRNDLAYLKQIKDAVGNAGLMQREAA